MSRTRTASIDAPLRSSAEERAGQVIRVTVLGSAFAGKTSLITQAVTRFSAAKTTAYAKTRRNQVYFMRLRPKGAKHVGLQLQDTPGGPLTALSPDEARAIADEPELAGDGHPDAAAADERSKLIEDPLNPILGRFKTLGFIVVFDVTRRQSFNKAQQLIRAVRKIYREHTPTTRENGEETPIILLANKRDQVMAGRAGADVVAPTEAQRVCDDQVGVYLFMGSAADNEFTYMGPSEGSAVVADRRAVTSEDMLMFLVNKIRSTHAWEVERNRQEQLSPFFAAASSRSLATFKSGNASKAAQEPRSCWEACCWCCAGRKRALGDD